MIRPATDEFIEELRSGLSGLTSTASGNGMLRLIARIEELKTERDRCHADYRHLFAGGEKQRGKRLKLEKEIKELKNEKACLEYRLDEANESNKRFVAAYNSIYAEWVQWVPENYYPNEWKSAWEKKS